MAKEHQYQTTLVWTGNKGSGTMDYRSYDRDFTISVLHKPDILGSSDSEFMGDKDKHNPEDLLVSSIASCHMLWFLHLCSSHGIIVLDYKDQAVGKMIEFLDGSGRFKEVVLHPEVTVSNESDIEKVEQLHAQAHQMCFIANSCNFPIKHEARCLVEQG